MARDGSGNFSLLGTLAPANQVSNSTSINAIMADIATALSDSINKDGTKAFVANQSLGGYKITSLAAGTALTDAAQLSQVQKASVQMATTVGGTVDAITLAFTPTITSYTTGMVVAWVSGGANTGATTINVDGLGAKTLQYKAAALAASTLGASGTVHEARYDGTQFQLLNPAVTATSTASTTEVLTGTNTTKAVTPDAAAALWEAGSDITDGATITIGEGGYFNLITSTTAITAFTVTTDKAGRTFRCRFNTARTLTHNGTSLILPGAANITTAQGDIAQFRSLESGNVVCEWYTKASGEPIVANGVTLLGTITTSSGTDANITGLTLTNYRFLKIITANSSSTLTADLLLGTSTSDDVTIIGSSGFGTGSNLINIEVDLFTGLITRMTNGVTVGVFAGPITTASTSVSVAVSAGAFDAGSFRVYGIK